MNVVDKLLFFEVMYSHIHVLLNLAKAFSENAFLEELYV